MKLTVTKLAQLLNIPKDRIYKWEKGTKVTAYEDILTIDKFLESTLENIPIALEHSETYFTSKTAETTLNNRIDDLIRIIEKQQETIHYLTTGRSQGKRFA